MKFFLKKIFWAAAAAAVPILLAACSVNKLAMNSIADALTTPGSSDVFSGDPDPALVGDALPFAITLSESLLQANPGHQGLILTTGSLFVMYANAFVQAPAEEWGYDRYAEQDEAFARAKALYLRGAGILYAGMDRRYPGFSGAALEELDAYLPKMKREDAPFLYWISAAELSAYSLDVFDFQINMRIPCLGAMITRAYELDPDFNHGAIDEFFIMYHAALPGSLGGDKSLCPVYFARALAKTGGLAASPYVSYAKSVCIPGDDYEGFKRNIDAALAVDIDANPAIRLENVLAQKKARFLLENAGEYFSNIPEEAE